MLSSFFLANSDKLLAALSALGATLGLGWFVAALEGSDLLTKVGAGSCIAICASVATAFYKTRAGTIKAQAEAKASEAATTEKATEALIKRLTESADQERARSAHDLEYARNRADTAEQIQHQERMGKHEALEQLNSVVLYAQVLAAILHEKEIEAFLQEKGIEVPEAPKIEFGRAVRAQDQATAKLLSTRSDSAKKTMRIDVPAVRIFHRHPRPVRASVTVTEETKSEPET